MQVSPIAPQTAENEAGVLARLNHFYVWGVKPAMQALRRTIADTAATDIPVLILGESGTGQGSSGVADSSTLESARRTIHQNSVPSFRAGPPADSAPIAGLTVRPFPALFEARFFWTTFANLNLPDNNNFLIFWPKATLCPANIH